MVISRRGLNCVNPNGRGEALRSRPIRTTSGLSITFTLLVVQTRSFGGLSILEAMRKQGLYFLRLRAEEIGASIADVLFGLGGRGVMAPKVVSIHFMDLVQKFESGFSLCGDGLPDGLVPNVFTTIVLLGLGTDREP